MQVPVAALEAGGIDQAPMRGTQVPLVRGQRRAHRLGPPHVEMPLAAEPVIGRGRTGEALRLIERFETLDSLKPLMAAVA